MHTLVALTASLFLVGCKADKTNERDTASSSPTDPASDTQADPCEPGDAPSIRLGHGELEYIDLEPDGSTQVELIHGPQGGFHVNMALSATQLDTTTPWTVSLTGTIDGTQMGDTRPLATMRCNRNVDALRAWSLLLIWDAQPEELHGRTADIDAHIIDSAGTEMSTSATIEIWDPALE